MDVLLEQDLGILIVSIMSTAFDFRDVGTCAALCRFTWDTIRQWLPQTFLVSGQLARSRGMRLVDFGARRLGIAWKMDNIGRRVGLHRIEQRSLSDPFDIVQRLGQAPEMAFIDLGLNNTVTAVMTDVPVNDSKVIYLEIGNFGDWDGICVRRRSWVPNPGWPKQHDESEIFFELGDPLPTAHFPQKFSIDFDFENGRDDHNRVFNHTRNQWVHAAHVSGFLNDTRYDSPEPKMILVMGGGGVYEDMRCEVRILNVQ